MLPVGRYSRASSLDIWRDSGYSENERVNIQVMIDPPCPTGSARQCTCTLPDTMRSLYRGILRLQTRAV